MLQMTEVLLPQAVITYLDNKQQKIDEQLTYAKKVQKGKDLWDSKSRPQFKKIRLKLDKMCVGQRRCNYCEDSAADEVEHPLRVMMLLLIQELKGQHYRNWHEGRRI